jgi:deoxyribonuclease-4
MEKKMVAKKRIGVHVGTSGGCFTAVQRAVDAGANTFQIFSASPRQWKAPTVKPEDAEKMRVARAELGVSPVSIHASYLINLCSQTESVRENSVDGFRGEVERALAWGAEYLVLHPGSWKGLTRDEGLRLAAEGIERAIGGLKWQDANFRILIENTAGAEFSLGGSFEQVAELVETLKACAPMGVCLDTCHTHVAGYDLVTTEGYEETMKLVGETVGFEAVKVWHCNDAKAAMGSKLDRHEHIGEGTIGAAAFRRLLHDVRFEHAAFIAETPVDEPGDEMRNVMALRALSAGPARTAS